ncbi:uncharacterized protein LOC125677092 isoform X2 [Ostrea edulis]|nr:uncharacterized protein LOC125677092 isoform X2 [Ostrea edulis]XP_056014871.1 uncharacterized protein LOC125677092 isoform X2 [Ostrea edulis]
MNGNCNVKFDRNRQFSVLDKYVLFITISLVLMIFLSECCNGNQIERRRRGQQRMPCLASVSTIVHKICPDSTESRNLRAKEVGCELMANSCADSVDYVYHCLLNEWGNNSLEICAPTTKIVGQYCAEFNVGGGIVQEHHKTNASCTLCPYIYNSSDSFRYGECFRGLVSNFTKTIEASFPISSTTFTSRYAPDTNTGNKWLISIPIAIHILLGYLCLFFGEGNV